MPGTLRTASILAALALALSGTSGAQKVAPPDDPVAEDPPLERLLDAKRLERFGNTYILKDTGERVARLAGLAQELAAVEERFAPLYAERARLEQVVRDARSLNTNARNAQTRAALREARDLAHAQAKSVLDAFNAQSRETFRRAEAEKAALADKMRLLVAETAKIYETIGADPQVKRVVRAYNRGHRPKIVLGPVAGPAEYRAAVLRDDAALLREKGMVLEKGHRWVVEPEARVGSLAVQAYNDLNPLAAVAAAVDAGSPAKLKEKRKAVADRLATAPEPLRHQLAAQVALLDTQIRRHSAQDPGMAAAWGESANHLAAARGKFLGAVAELRRAADSAPAARKQLEADGEALETLEEVAEAAAPRAPKRAPHVAEAPEYRHGLASLAALEAAIRVERLPMERGAGGRGLVAVTLNGSHPVRAAVDPSAPTTRLPSALAAAVGASPGAEAVGVDVLLPGGQTVRGRAGLLRSVALGSVTVEHVPCVVLPADAPGPPPPALGVDLLAMIGAEADPDGETLTVTRVISPAQAPRHEAPATAGR